MKFFIIRSKSTDRYMTEDLRHNHLIRLSKMHLLELFLEKDSNKINLFNYDDFTNVRSADGGWQFIRKLCLYMCDNIVLFLPGGEFEGNEEPFISNIIDELIIHEVNTKCPKLPSLRQVLNGNYLNKIRTANHAGGLSYLEFTKIPHDIVNLVIAIVLNDLEAIEVDLFELKNNNKAGGWKVKPIEEVVAKKALPVYKEYTTAIDPFDSVNKMDVVCY